MGRFPHQRLWRQNGRAIRETMAYANFSVDALSGGQPQRCWIAMVLTQETELLLLEEPTTFLDLKVDLLEL